MQPSTPGWLRSIPTPSWSPSGTTMPLAVEPQPTPSGRASSPTSTSCSPRRHRRGHRHDGDHRATRDLMLRAAGRKAHLHREAARADRRRGRGDHGRRRRPVSQWWCRCRGSTTATPGRSRRARRGQLGELTYAGSGCRTTARSPGWLPERFYDPETAIGGALTDLGCHPVYLMQLFLGAVPARSAPPTPRSPDVRSRTTPS